MPLLSRDGGGRSLAELHRESFGGSVLSAACAVLAFFFVILSRNATWTFAASEFRVFFITVDHVRECDVELCCQ